MKDDQDDLFDKIGKQVLDGVDEPRARKSDPDTSHQAADRAKLTAGSSRLEVLLLHFATPAGLTDFEVASRMHRQQTSVGKRRGELRDAGYIEDSGFRRAAPSGSSAIVWRITRKGLDKVVGLREEVHHGNSNMAELD